MRCKLCRQKAVYAPLRFCKEHFLAYYEKKVRRYLESTHTRNTSILIGVSGGKDSSALAEVLAGLAEEYGLKLGLLCIDLRIPDYSDKGTAVARTIAKRTGLKLHIVDMRDWPRATPDFANKKPCGPCGTLKRYLLNKVAVEEGYAFVATGHNLDDEFSSALHNLFQRNVGQLRRSQKKLPPRPELKLAGRVKPLYYLTEKENRLFCLLRGIPHDADECPYSMDNPQLSFKKRAVFGRDEKRNLLKSIEQLQRPAPDIPVGEEAGSLHACPSCGYATTSKDACVFCKLMTGER
ncbi:adenine nucleotide alpha hydrolase family protein [Candidatus Woesearchaeota archaeon]|nr:MAG: adenine nucleotide alpha hydrolase family protein [Candidatus Woesearchaeota archaeon]